MDINEAWGVLDDALNTGTMAAHGAGMINRLQVGQINEAQRVVSEYINELKKSNDGFVEFINKQAVTTSHHDGPDEGESGVTATLVTDPPEGGDAAKPCECEEKVEV